MAEPVIRVRTVLSIIAALLSIYDLSSLILYTLMGLDFILGGAIILALIEVGIFFFILISLDPFKKEYYD